MEAQTRSEFLNQVGAYKKRMKFLRKHIAKNMKQAKIKKNLSSEDSFHFSQESFQDLKRTSLDKLVDNQQAKGCYVILRTLIFPVYTKSTYMLKSIVEDHEGNVVVLNLMLFEEKETFNPGSVFILKEPFLTMDDELKVYSVYCVTLTDLILIDKASKYHDLTKEISWKSVVFDLETSSPDTANGWKKQGEDYFGSKNYTKALESYLVSLNLAIEAKDTTLITQLNVNISDTYFELEYFENAVSYAQKAFSNRDALYTAGRAYYKLREFKKAADQFQKLLFIQPENKLACNWLEKCEARLNEQDLVSADRIDEIRLLSQSEPQTCIDCADYIGPIKMTSRKGLTVVATEEIHPGTVLLVTKALCQTFNKPPDTKSEIQDSNNKPVKEMVIQVAKMMKKNPDTIGNQVNDFMISCFGKEPIKQFCNDSDKRARNNNDKELIIDTGSLHDLLNNKCYTKRHLDNGATEMGFFVLPAYFKESCLANAQWQTCNDVMVVHSVTPIRKGQEVLLHKSDHKWSLQKTSFKCSCVLCNLDKKEPVAVLKERANLTKRFESMAVDNHFHGLERLVTHLEKTYCRTDRTQFQIDLFHPYLILSCLYKQEKGFGAALSVADQALAVLGLDRHTLLKSFAKNPVAPIFPDGVLMVVWIVRIAYVYRSLYRKSNQRDIWENIFLSLSTLFYGPHANDIPLNKYFFENL